MTVEDLKRALEGMPETAVVWIQVRTAIMPDGSVIHAAMWGKPRSLGVGGVRYEMGEVRVDLVEPPVAF